MKHVQSCLSARKDPESSFHHCGSLVKLVQACVCAEGLAKAVLTIEEVLSSSCKPVYVRERLDKAVLTADVVL